MLYSVRACLIRWLHTLLLMLSQQSLGEGVYRCIKPRFTVHSDLLVSVLSWLHYDATSYTRKLSQVPSRTEVAQQPCCEQYWSLDAIAYKCTLATKSRNQLTHAQHGQEHAYCGYWEDCFLSHGCNMHKLSRVPFFTNAYIAPIPTTPSNLPHFTAMSSYISISDRHALVNTGSIWCARAV